MIRPARAESANGAGLAPGGPDRVSPATKAARHAKIVGILTGPGAQVRSQDELAGRLAYLGVRVTQATLSRDLVEIGAVRLRGPDGALVYALPDSPPGPAGWVGPPSRVADPAEDANGDDTLPWPAGLGGLASGSASAAVTALAKVATDLLLSAEASGNLVVIHTPPGAAQLLASMIDRAEMRAVLGTVAGDDTVLVIARDPGGGGDLASGLLRIAEWPRRPRPHRPADNVEEER